MPKRDLTTPPFDVPTQVAKHLHDMSEEELEARIRSLEDIIPILRKEWHAAWRQLDKLKRQARVDEVTKRKE